MIFMRKVFAINLEIKNYLQCYFASIVLKNVTVPIELLNTGKDCFVIRKVNLVVFRSKLFIASN